MKQLNWYQIFGNTHTIPDGRTVTPTDDIQTLLHCANIWDKDYTTLEEVLADDDTLFLICISDNAIDYLVRSTTWASYNDIVPKMTSNTTPSGVCFAYNTYSSSTPAYYAFNEDYSNNWASATGANGAVGYIFDTPQILGKIGMDSYYLYKCVIEGSNDTTNGSDGTWEQIGDELTIATDDSNVRSDISVLNGKAYSAFRLRITSGKGGSSSRGAIRILQFSTLSIVTSESAMKYIGASDYASETLLSDSTWLTAIDGSAYKDYVINAKVPNMTSATAPSGEVISSGFNGSYPAWKAFDGNDTTQAAISAGDGGYIGYKFASASRILGFRFFDSDNKRLKTLKIQGSNDNNTWTDLTENIDVPDSYDLRSSFANTTSYLYYRIYQVTTASPYTNISYMTVQFYGRENAGVQTWLKAGGITNKKYTTVSEVLSDLTTLATLMSSTDAIDYLVTAKGWATEICSDSNAMADIGMNNYAANTLLADETWAEAIGNSTYFTSVLNVSVPAMTDNTHPYGECFASDVNSVAWKAFNGTNTGVSDMWGSDNAVPQSLGYKFTSPVRIAKVMIANRKGASPGYIHSVRDFALEGSNDGVAYTKIKDFLNTNNTQGAETYYSNAIGTTCTYYHINISSTNEGNTPYIGMLQFYGRKDI